MPKPYTCFNQNLLIVISGSGTSTSLTTGQVIGIIIGLMGCVVIVFAILFVIRFNKKKGVYNTNGHSFSNALYLKTTENITDDDPADMGSTVKICGTDTLWDWIKYGNIVICKKIFSLLEQNIIIRNLRVYAPSNQSYYEVQDIFWTYIFSSFGAKAHASYCQHCVCLSLFTYTTLFSYIYRTSDYVYMIYSEVACQYSNESTRTSIELTHPFTVNQIQNITCSVNDL